MSQIVNESTLAELIAQFGSSSSTAWIEKERYQLWQPSEPIPESSFVPIQGYMEKDHYIFAWGDPIVSSPAALPSVVSQFAAFCQSNGKKPVWLCISRELVDVLAKELGWSGICCVTEDQVDPAHIVALTSPVSKGKQGQHAVKDLKKNLAKAEKAGVNIREIKRNEWREEEREQVEHGIAKWKAVKHGIQLASTSFQPWVDIEHRRFWVARVADKIVGVLILTPIMNGSWQIKNCASFPSAPKGTSEALIYTMLKDIDQEWSRELGSPPVKPGRLSPSPSPSISSSSSRSSSSEHRTTYSPFSHASDTRSRSSSETVESERPLSSMKRPIFATDPLDVTTPIVFPQRRITFGLSAAPKLEAVHHLKGWKVKALVGTYSNIMAATGLLRRGEFRHKFDTQPIPMYVSYPANEGFGLEGANLLLKVLRK